MRVCVYAHTHTHTYIYIYYTRISFVSICLKTPNYNIALKAKTAVFAEGNAMILKKKSLI